MSELSNKVKVPLIILVSIVGLIILAFVLLNFWANQKLPKILGDKVASKNIDVSIIGARVHFYNPSVIIDSTDNGSGFRLKADAKSILIDQINLWDLFFDKEISVGNFIVDSLKVTADLPQEKASTGGQEEVSLFVKDIFTRIKVAHFELIGTDVLVTKRPDAEKIYDIKQFNLIADGIVLDTANAIDIFPLQLQKTQISTREVLAKIGDEYILTCENMVIEDTTFSVENIKIASIYTKEEFVKHHQYEKPRLDVSADFMQVENLLWGFKGKVLETRSGKAEVEKLLISVFKDKSPPQKPDHVKPLLATLFKELPFTVTVDTFTLKNSLIEYEQLPVEHPRSARVSFEKLYMTAYNLTNDTVRIQERPVTILDVFCQFMGKGDLNVTIKLFMQTDADFEVTGKLGQIPMTYVNQVLVPLTGAEANGQVNELGFKFRGDAYHSEGSMFVKT